MHFGAVLGQPLLPLALIALLLLPMVWSRLRQRQGMRVGLGLLAALLLGVIFGSLSLLQAVPVAINLSLCALFAGTLRRGRTPLITAYVELQYDSVPPALRRYTRGVTVAWSIFFALMALQALLLALFAPVEIWSLFVNFLNYVFVLLLFVIEYATRRRVLADRPHASFGRFLRTLARTDFRRLLKQTT